MNIDWYLLGGLTISAFTSATILPGTSDAAFLGLVYHRPDLWFLALMCASIANTLGSIVSYLMGRTLSQRSHTLSYKTQSFLQRYGVWSLLLAWLPIIGDALPITAGWLRFNLLHCIIMLMIGKFIRYSLLLLSIQTWL